MLIEPEGKLWVYHAPVDLRKSYYSLSRLVEKELSKESLSGDGFIFINRQKTLAKVLWWDRTGWCLLLKKLSTGRFRIREEGVLKELEKIQVRRFFDGL
jgi:transposase